ncbi:hypothetical protein [Streptomyces albidoflavus]|uniref:hypothetical protein n=1 Tax=Streptomyces albidoflavus TaxID=1886 RepID=UPI00259BE1A7|nr:hypothetical protein [Streptomyces albidoflavus]WJK68411.1 hypothetical protein QIA47_18710 [Streptomyces albidoflavus]WTB65608.1 hypothetical protein OIF23_24020 [Streptomyces albidoflavus]WTC41273.1 hypothetical protein OH810_06830 [Streptomyces albidoflavus]WTD44304.1 hypothetical protein OH730_23760 [Streptomyces albidoflavus]WTD81426.1 hypothetical protein OHA92_06820 [Streptomyces albidoflavus]
MRTRTGTAVGRAGRLLLLAALLLGVLTMHTLGHPTGDHGGAHSGAHSAAHGPGTVAAAPAAPAGSGAAEHHSPAAGIAAGAVTGAVTGTPDSSDPLPGTDPLSVCLAVLAALTLGLLLRAGGLLGGGAAPGSAARVLLTGRRGAQWPIAPPTRLALARLSVLRI